MANGVTSIAGLGNDKAARIWFRALTVYMTSSTNYAGARVATLSAATDLYGAGSAEYNTVNTAWKAVNVL
jgi:Zn-dependent metalloprotease